MDARLMRTSTETPISETAAATRRIAKYDAGAVGHSVGGKVAVSTNSAEVLQSGPDSDDAIPRNRLHCYDFWPLPASDPVSPLCTEMSQRRGSRGRCSAGSWNNLGLITDIDHPAYFG
jgi:hypothetical protein